MLPRESSARRTAGCCARAARGGGVSAELGRRAGARPGAPGERARRSSRPGGSAASPPAVDQERRPGLDCFFAARAKARYASPRMATEYTIHYEFRVEDGREIEFTIRLHPQTLLNLAPITSPPDWARLEF